MKQIDRIRNMNAEELAELLFQQPCNHCAWGKAFKSFGCNYDCYTGIKVWLESEVEE